MLFASISSENYKSVNGLNEVPFLSSIIVFAVAILPTILLQYLIELIFGKIPVFDLGFTIWFNTLFIHIFVLYYFKIKIRIFFLPSYVFCLVAMAICYKQVIPYL